MEQESHHAEETTEFQAPAISVLCANNCGFFGSSATNNLCSKCYRDHFLHKSKIDAVVAAVEAAKAVHEVEKSAGTADQAQAEAGIEVGNTSRDVMGKKPANRCGTCNKKVGLMGFKCRCGEVFCSLHRYSDKHGCLFDYKGAGQDAITKANPVVKADKVDKI